MLRLLVAVTLGTAGALPSPAQDAPKPAPPLTKVPEGRYSLAYGPSFALNRVVIVDIAVKAVTPVVTTVAVSPAIRRNDIAVEFGTPTVADGDLTLPVKFDGKPSSFVGRPDPRNPARFLGTFGDANRAVRGLLEPTTADEFAANGVAVIRSPTGAARVVAELRAAPGKLRSEARKVKDDDERAKLLAEADAVDKANAVTADALLRKLAVAGEDHFSGVAALELLGALGRVGVTEGDVRVWAGALVAEATPYGPRIAAQARIAVAETLLSQKKYPPVALEYALGAAADQSLPTKDRYTATKLLQRVQVQAGLTDDADATAKQVVALDAVLDAEYLKAVPPFKPTKYAGRTDKSANRVAVMELFTGAQCPPCVAADVGFDALITSYKPADAIFLQYHEHIPGPDPLTNADAVARMAYYSKRHKEDFGGTPSAAFNGKPAAGGGGGMANAKDKYAEFTKVLADALEETTAVSVRGAVKRAGDELSVTVELSGTKDLTENAVLRLVLVEDTVKYVGGNGLRFHHHVVRSLLGTAKGVKLADLRDGKFTTTQNLTALRADLTKYLDGYAAKGRAFPYAERPLDLKGLKVVALVQDDTTGEVVQAAQFDAAE